MPARLAALFVPAFLLLAACGSAGDDDPAASPGDGPAQAVPGEHTGQRAGEGEGKPQQEPAGRVAPDADWARRMSVRGASEEPGAPFYKPEVEVMESMPVQFALNLTHDLPMAGGRLSCDDVQVDVEAGRIVAQVTEHQPEGPAATVMTPTQLRLALGNLKQGRYRLDLLLRKGKGARYELLQSLTLLAR
jgi:hypothetical protein